MINKYIFLKLEGTLLYDDICKENTPLFSNDFGIEATKTLNTLIKDTGAKIILLDAQKIPHIQLIQKFTKAGFEHSESIIGQILKPETVKVKTPYDGLGLKPFPITTGNCIKHWVDNFIATPYKLYPKKSKYFEIWELKQKNWEFKGMGELLEGKDFDYRILGKVDGLLDNQISKNVECASGLTVYKAKELILTF